MSNILETLQHYTQKDPDAVILRDEAHAKGISYARLEDMSGRVYSWLKEKGIGREDFVLINLPRGVLPVIAMVGVWKAGAAWAMVEDTCAPERIAYIRKDTGCKAELTANNWDSVMKMAPLEGFEPADDHDAAYAIYTSGTTGNPKGVLHERGNLDRAIRSITDDGVCPFYDGEQLAMMSPLNFVASIIVILAALNVFRATNHILSYSTAKNTMKLGSYFLSNKITITFLTPSYVRMLGGRKTPYLRMMFVGSEPANNIYVEGLDIVNIYASSETGYAVGYFHIDKSYDICPIGRPQLPTKIVLLDEDGREVPDGETGELCCEDPFVRGYISLPEESAKAFRDGMFRTGDLARREADGRYVIIGRNSDMIKINGNRIEPAEVEAAIKQALGIDWAAVKGFETGGRSFLCAYYTANVKVDPDRMRQELSKSLPSYMIPAHYIKLDSVPLKPNGKMDRNALPAPEIKIAQGEYAAPANETEEKLCSGMAAVLGVSRVGIHDDFYEMGGDSLGSIQLVSECGLPGLSVSEVFRGRTPEKIAKLYAEMLERDGGVTPDERNDEAMKTEHPLTAEQLYMYNYQMFTPASTMYNLFTVMKMDKALVDPEHIAAAMGKAVRNHPALLTVFAYNDAGELVQRYSPEIFEEIRVEKTTEFEFNFIKDMLVYPFKMVGGKLYRCRVFETEENCYVFFDVHHTLFDGTSLKVFMGSIGKAFAGMEPDKDYYYLTLQRREDDVNNPFYEESRQYFEELFEGEKWSSYPKTDHKSRENEMGEMLMPLLIDSEKLSAVEKEYGVTRNEFFITAMALSVALYNKTPNVKLSWIYNGREDSQTMSSVGLLFRDLPVGLKLREMKTLREVFAEVHEQVQKGIEHSCYPYVDLHNRVGKEESAYLLYQQDIRDMKGLEGIDVEFVDVRQNQAASQTILDMEILDGKEGLILMMDYAASRYNEVSMRVFKDIFWAVSHLLAHSTRLSDRKIGQIGAELAAGRLLARTVKTVFRKKR